MTPVRSTPLAAVSEFLSQQPAPTEVATPGREAAAPAPASLIPKEGISIPMETEAEKKDTPEGPHDSGINPNPIAANPDGLPTVGNMLTTSLSRGFAVEPPTDDERMLFLTALCHNEPVVWDVNLCGDAVTMRVRSTPNYRIEDIMLAWAESKLGPPSKENGKHGVSLALYHTHLQRAYTFMRIMSSTFRTAAGTKTTEFDLGSMDDKLLGAPSPEEAIKIFDDWITERTKGNMNHMIFSIMVEALSVHEQKFCTCLRQAANPNFWRPGQFS